jgi:general secretion pathway protein F
MGAYHYKALDNEGKLVKGVIEGDSERHIRQQLRSRKLKPVEVNVSGKEQASSTLQLAVFKPRIKQQDLALITRQLATLIQSNMPLDEALTATAQQARKPKIKSLILQIRSRVVEGHSLAYALGDFPLVFNDMYCSMVKAGEHAGFLGKVMESLADYTEERQHTQQDLSAAMIYPIILMVLAVAVVSLLMIFVVPQLVSMFAHTNKELPMLTQIVIGTSDFFSHYWWTMPVGLIVLIVAARQFLKDRARKKLWHHFLLKIPFISGIISSMDSARFASTLSILTSSGVPLLEGLRIAGAVLVNLVLRDASKAVALSVQEGSSLNKALAQAKVFPPMMVHMVASGEASGELETMLARSASNQERELKMVLGNMMRVLEPLMIVIMAVVVCTIVFAILLPIIEMNNLVA